MTTRAAAVMSALRHARLMATGAALTLSLALSGCGGEPPQPGSTLAPTSAPLLIAGVGFKDLPPSAYKVEWIDVAAPAKLAPGEKASVRVTLRNASTSVWPAGGTKSLMYTVRLSHRWLRPDGKPLAGYASRVDLAQPLKPGESVTLTETVTAPPGPGTFGLQVDMVHEGVTWFERFSEKKVVPVRVQ